MKNKYSSRRDEESADRNLQIRGLGLFPCCVLHIREGLSPLRARCTPAGDNVSGCSPPPCAPSPLPCTLYLWKVGDKGTERMKRRRRMESDPVSSYPSCERNVIVNMQVLPKEVINVSIYINVRLWEVCGAITSVTRDINELFSAFSSQINRKLLCYFGRNAHFLWQKQDGT